MDELVKWFLLNIVSPLALPLVVVASLCLLFDVRPEPIIKASLDVASSVVIAILKLIELTVRAGYEMWRNSCTCPGTPPKPLPKSLSESPLEQPTGSPDDWVKESLFKSFRRHGNFLNR